MLKSSNTKKSSFKLAMEMVHFLVLLAHLWFKKIWEQSKKFKN